MTVRVRFFALARELVGSAELTRPLPKPATVAGLLDALQQDFPSLGKLRPHLRVAVNESFATVTAELPDGADVALIPPVSGGSGRAQIQESPIHLETVVAAVASPARGGVVTFAGVVRNHSRGKNVTRLFYEAYVPMALKVMDAIAAEAETKWPGVHVALEHRVGELQPGENAVTIAAAAPHRKDAFLACEYVINRLKEDVPIWKKEFYDDGETWVGAGP